MRKYTPERQRKLYHLNKRLNKAKADLNEANFALLKADKLAAQYNKKVYCLVNKRNGIENKWYDLLQLIADFKANSR